MPGAKSPIPPHEAAETAPRRAEPEAGAAELYRHHAAWLHGRLRRRLGAGAQADAEDLVQETYARAVEIARTQPISHPRALLLRIAGRLAVDHARRARHTASLPEGAAETAASPPDQEADLLLKQVVLSLPPRLRDAFVLSRVAGLSYNAIARELGVSVKTVEARMGRALALCAARLRG